LNPAKEKIVDKECPSFTLIVCQFSLGATFADFSVMLLVCLVSILSVLVVFNWLISFNSVGCCAPRSMGVLDRVALTLLLGLSVSTNVIIMPTKLAAKMCVLGYG
jgi:hypothetical protein